MSMTRSAILSRSDVPSHSGLKEAIKGLKFQLAVDESYVPMESSGYLPCTINGEDSGINIRFESAAAYLAKFPGAQAQAGERETLITLRSEGDPREDVCVLMIAAILAQNFGAIVHDPKKDVMYSAEKLISQARSQFAELD